VSGDTAEMGSKKCTKIFGNEMFNRSVFLDEEKMWGKNVKML
jgi:hypothetical protein